MPEVSLDPNPQTNPNAFVTWPGIFVYFFSFYLYVIHSLIPTPSLPGAVFFLTSFFCLIYLIPPGCHSGEAEKSKQKSGKRQAPLVTLFTATPKPLGRTLTSFVTLTGRNQTEVFSKFGGIVRRGILSEGTLVRAGQVLFSVDRQEPGESFLNVPVPSPINGRIGRWNVDNGSQIAPADAVVLIVDDSSIRATIDVSTSDWITITPNLAVNVIAEKQSIPAKIISIARAADAASGKGTIEIELAKTAVPLRSGMRAKVQIFFPPQNRLLVPSQAVRFTDAGAFVFMVDEQRNAKKIKIDFTLWDADQVEVLSELPKGAQLVFAGINLVADGKSVRTESQGAQP